MVFSVWSIDDWLDHVSQSHHCPAMMAALYCFNCYYAWTFNPPLMLTIHSQPWFPPCLGCHLSSKTHSTWKSRLVSRLVAGCFDSYGCLGQVWYGESTSWIWVSMVSLYMVYTMQVSFISVSWVLKVVWDWPWPMQMVDSLIMDHAHSGLCKLLQFLGTGTFDSGTDRFKISFVYSTLSLIYGYHSIFQCLALPTAQLLKVCFLDFSSMSSWSTRCQ